MQRKSIETIFYSAIGVLVMAAILVGFNVITSAFRKRMDLTQEKAYTLSDGTKAVLKKIDAPVKIRFYCTRTGVSSPTAVLLKGYARKVEDLLAEYKQIAGRKLIIERYDPQPDTDAEDSAGLDGVEPRTLPGGEQFYLGLVVSAGVDVKETVPFLAPNRERLLEYDLSRAISRVLAPEKPIIGIMSPLPVFGGPASPMMMQMGQQPTEPWIVLEELRRDFDVRKVEMDAEKIDDDVKVLLVIHPKDISEGAQYAIDQFVMRGGKLIAFLDPLSQVDSRGQNPMAGMMSPSSSSLDKLLKAWGLQFDSGKVVADRNFKMVLGEERSMEQQRPVWLALPPAGIQSNDVMTAELNNVWVFASGAFTGVPAQGLKETVLLKSTADSQLVEGMMANFATESILRDFKPSGTEYPLAVRLTGKFKTAFPDGKPAIVNADTNAPAPKETAAAPLKETQQENSVVLAGDSDMIYDGFTVQKRSTIIGVLMEQMNENLSFVLNAVEQMSGDSSLIGVRSRAAQQHPFSRIDKIDKQADEKTLAKVTELQKSRDEAVARLNELQKQKSQDQRFIMSPQQEAEVEELRKKEASFGREIRQVEKERRRETDALKHKVEAWNIAAMPLIVILAGVGRAVYRRKRVS